MERLIKDDGGVTWCHKWHLLPMQDGAMAYVDHLAIKQERKQNECLPTLGGYYIPAYVWWIE